MDHGVVFQPNPLLAGPIHGQILIRHEFLRRHQSCNLCLEISLRRSDPRLGLLIWLTGAVPGTPDDPSNLSLEYLMPHSVRTSIERLPGWPTRRPIRSDMTNFTFWFKKKKRVKESEKAGNGGRKQCKIRYIAFATNAPWMDVGEYSKRRTIGHAENFHESRSAAIGLPGLFFACGCFSILRSCRHGAV